MLTKPRAPRSARGHLLFGAGSGSGEAVGIGSRLDDVASEGEAVDDGRAKAGVGEGLGPANWGWHLFLMGWVPGDLAVSGV